MTWPESVDEALCFGWIDGARRENKSGIYSYEQRPEKLPARYGRILRRQPKAWTYFNAQTRAYQRAASWWILSAKREETRLKRLAQLAQLSAVGRRISPFASR